MISGIEKNSQIDKGLQYLILPVLYFDIFSYPLTREEIVQYGPGPSLSETESRSMLDQLVYRRIFFYHRGYYSMEDRPEWVDQREENEFRAQHFLVKAKNMSRLIARFPFVRAVFVSGSLSKNTMPRDGDIDYFIITRRGGLWIARTLLVLYKKIFLLNSHRYFCVNYFVDEDHLKIEEQNIYTATELMTLLPFAGKEFYVAFCEANPWAWSFYPNMPSRNTDEVPGYQGNLPSSLLEGLLGGAMGQRLNQILMNLTLGYWRHKFSHYDPATFERSFQSTLFLSRHHPVDFQNKVIHAYRERIRKFEENHGLSLHVES